MFLSIDIGGTSIKYGVIDKEGSILTKNSIYTQDDKSLFFKDLLSIYESVSKKFSIKGIGISAPGIIDREGKMITAGAIMSLYGENLKLHLEEHTHLPVTIDNDANAVAIAEKWLGHGKHLNNYICLVLGTGIGGGIVINNQIYSGTHGMAGEFGWGIFTEIPDAGPIEQYSLNNYGAVVSGLCQKYNEEKLKLNPDHIPVTDAKEILLKESEGDEDAKKVVELFYEKLSIALINLISFYDPDAILIGGGISQNIEFEKRLQNSVNEIKKRHEAINRITPLIDIPIIMAKLKNDAGLLGAAYQIKNKLEPMN